MVYYANGVLKTAHRNSGSYKEIYDNRGNIIGEFVIENDSEILTATHKYNEETVL